MRMVEKRLKDIKYFLAFGKYHFRNGIISQLKLRDNKLASSVTFGFSRQKGPLRTSG